MDRNLTVRAEDIGFRMARSTKVLFSADIPSLASDHDATERMIDSFAMYMRRIMAAERGENEESRDLLAESRTANSEAFGD